ncbi:serine hydroxymethyltransferase [Candidatus Uhrbacteria bacterium CG_4_9_14_3_um_filter_36_7]|uniref:Serine hydroxymethyltransferase n=1 Tax=Candidatus Uhrbacteria bacterium CG_4_9_14_3_um_filter_36_7 TaxID=1975033 RepID=A0A2M7XF27_9BACT|nr:MAG: serine hydroxymethyltransferase [Candidatus Uhrbacteria bacterium CG_4_9_14_3_um_filter_36_7]
MLLQTTDPELAKSLNSELKRQQEGLEMIPSENYVSKYVLEALGSILTNKYSEGFPDQRYYGGNQFIDEIEKLAKERAKKLFGVDHANIQPYSGSPANQAAIFALCNPGDTIMGMHLFYGGHLTHGWKVNFSAKYYRSIQYTTGSDGLLDYDQIETLVKKERPKVLFCGATAYPRLYDYPRLAKIIHEVDGYFIADIAHESGLIAAGVIPSPVGYADIITTTTHKTLRGPRGGMILCNGKPSHPLAPLKKGENPREHLPTLIDRAVFPGLQGGPHNHQTAAIAVTLGEALQPSFKIYAEQILKNAKSLADALIDKGFELVTNGTDNHLMLINTTKKGLTGKEAELALDKAGITVNKNTIPFDERSPYDPSGIRLGTPALTTRGMKEKEMEQIAIWISEVFDHSNDEKVLAHIREQVKATTDQFPIYKEIEY